MALKIYRESDFIVFIETGGTFNMTAHYSNVRWERTLDDNVAFYNTAQNERVIAAAPVDEIVDETDTPYGADFDAFNTAFSAALPQQGGGGTSDDLLLATFAIRDSVIITEGYVNEIRAQIANPVSVTHTLRTTLDTFEIPANARRVQIIALASGAFTFNGVSYPITTANGVIDALEIGNGIAPLSGISYEVTAANVLQIVEL